MADKYRIIKMTFCGPSDVRKQMEAARKIVTEWNIQHGDALETMVSFHHWSTDSVPDMAERAQAVINKQLIDESHLITAVFWNRFGTPSGMAQSGTEEEIRRSIDNGARVLLYFAEMESVRNEPDPVQLAKVKAFKAEMQPKGLAWSFKSTRSFEDFFRTHLAKTIHELAPPKPARKPAARKSAPRQAIKGNGNFQAGGDVNAPVTINFESPRVEVSKYPKNSIGADADAAGYVEYMCDLWVRYKSPEGLDVTELWKRIGRSIKNKFKLRGARTRGHISMKRFEGLVDYLVAELKKTPVGRQHVKRGTKLCRTFEEFTSGKM